METSENSDSTSNSDNEYISPNKRLKPNSSDTDDPQEVLARVIAKQFDEEILKKQKEQRLIEKNLLEVKKTIHLLKYSLVKSLYQNKEIINKSSCSTSQIYKQEKFHPAIKEVVGKKPKNVSLQRNINETFISPNSFYEEFEEPPPIEELNLDEFIDEIEDDDNESHIRKKKTKFMFIIGNTSKFLGFSDQTDVYTHKWMLYIKGVNNTSSISHFVKKVRVFLHPSYKPDDIIELDEEPFHLTRRGWGEFPVRVQIYFQESVNKPINIVHTLKLDKTKTGKQTLGRQTLVEVWLKTSNALEKEEDDDDTDEDKYYYEDENNINDNTVFKVTSNYKSEEKEYHKYKGKHMPLLKATLLKTTSEEMKNFPFLKLNFKLRENMKYNNFGKMSLIDHCYTFRSFEDMSDYHRTFVTKIQPELYSSIHQLIFNLFKSLPIITKFADDPFYRVCYPYSCSSLEEFSSWNYFKRFCNEWHRARHIKRLLIEHKIPNGEKWTTKCILMYGRLHAFTPLIDYSVFINKYNFKEIPEKINTNYRKSTLTEYNPINETAINSNFENLNDSTIVRNEIIENYADLCRNIKQEHIDNYKEWDEETSFGNEEYNKNSNKTVIVKQENIDIDYDNWYKALGIKKEYDYNNEEYLNKTINKKTKYFKKHNEKWKNVVGVKKEFCEKDNKNLKKSEIVDNDNENEVEMEVDEIYDKIQEKSDNYSSNDDSEIEVVEPLVVVKKEKKPIKKMLIPIQSSESDKNLLPICLNIKEIIANIGIHLNDEEVEPGIFMNVVERLLVKSLECFAEEVIRKAWANHVSNSNNIGSPICAIQYDDVWQVLLERKEFDVFISTGLGTK